jgi:hypothetical protein
LRGVDLAPRGEPDNIIFASGAITRNRNEA